MSKSTAAAENSGHSRTHLDLLKKFKRFNPLEPSLSLVGFFMILLLFIGCMFCVDYSAVARGVRSHGVVLPGLHISSLPSSPSPLHPSSSPSSSSSSSSPSSSSTLVRKALVEFLDQDGDACDVFDGNWVWDESYPLYVSTDCSFLDQGFRCSENGRPDSIYTKWRWQPKGCKLPRFDAGRLLEKLRNKRLVFIGDSIGRNQWESLLCMLSSAIPNKANMHEVNGSPITKYTEYLAFKLEDFNCTVEYYRSRFLVVQGRAPAGAPKEVKMTLRVDLMDRTSHRWRDADVLILNAGHWWNYEKTLKMDCYFQIGEEVKMNMSIGDAFRKSIETVFNWIATKVNTNKTDVFFRTYAPVHFSGGEWNTGGGCLKETLPNLAAVPESFDSHFRTILDVLSERLNKSEVVNFNLLNITQMSLHRKDGHASIYYLGPGKGPAPKHRQDCSHWCLPGVPDSWNEILYALILKRELLRTINRTEISQVSV